VSQAIIASSDEDEEVGTVTASIPQPKVQVEPPKRSPKSKKTPISKSKAKSKRPDSSDAAAKSGASILERPSEPKSDVSTAVRGNNFNILTNVRAEKRIRDVRPHRRNPN
jgi:hypothetical protein